MKKKERKKKNTNKNAISPLASCCKFIMRFPLFCLTAPGHTRQNTLQIIIMINICVKYWRGKREPFFLAYQTYTQTHTHTPARTNTRANNFTLNSNCMHHQLKARYVGCSMYALYFFYLLYKWYVMYTSKPKLEAMAISCV